MKDKNKIWGIISAIAIVFLVFSLLSDLGIFKAKVEIKSNDEKKSIVNKDKCAELEPEVWYEVKEFSGAGSKVTELFKINSETWRYTLNCNELRNLNLNKKTEEYGIVGVDSQTLAHCNQNGEPNYVHDGPGEYYFDYMVVNSYNEWTIKVEAKKTSCDN